MAATAGGVAVGSAVGHTIGAAMTGNSIEYQSFIGHMLPLICLSSHVQVASVAMIIRSLLNNQPHQHLNRRMIDIQLIDVISIRKSS
jgi:hypothetical protein